MSSLLQELLDDPSLTHEELFRRLVQARLQDVIDAEATVKAGADRYQRSEQRLTRRDETRTKNLATPAGQLELAIPKPREGSFFPSLLHPRRRVDKALYSVIYTAWIKSISTGKADELVKALGNQTDISTSSVSRICGDINEIVSTFLTHPLWATPGSLTSTSTSATTAMSSPTQSSPRSVSPRWDLERS